MIRRAIPLLCLLLAACGGPDTGAGGASPQLASTGKPVSAKAANTGPRADLAPGALVGAGPAQLRRQFGQPRLDYRDGPAHRLQWRGAGCVLDVVLYANSAGAEQATYAEARTLGGANMARDACAATLRRRP